MSESDRARIENLGAELAKRGEGTWILISGKITNDGKERGTKGKIRDMLISAFGYPEGASDPARRIHLLLDSQGGDLDAAYSVALFLTAYTQSLDVYVPLRAKSASTLLALAAKELHLSPFGELGPLDTQLYDPRNPAQFASALDCYQSVDYVRTFAITTMGEVLKSLLEDTDRQITLGELVIRASDFTLGAVAPMLQNLSALDFGSWGRSLQIGQRYAQRLLGDKSKNLDQEIVDKIAHDLVFSYTHHPFPIDIHEAERLRLPVKPMDKETYESSVKVVEACARRNFVGFLSGCEAERFEETERARRPVPTRRPHTADFESHPRAEYPDH